MTESNFTFLQTFPPLFSLAYNAERYLADDPNTSLIKTRQFA